MAQFAKRVVPGNGTVPAAIGGSPGVFEKNHPALAEYLTLGEWEPGVVRQTSSLLIFCDEGVVKAMLNDRDGARIAFVAAGGITEVLKAVERGLVGSTLDWRPDRKVKSKRGG